MNDAPTTVSAIRYSTVGSDRAPRDIRERSPARPRHGVACRRDSPVPALHVLPGVRDTNAGGHGPGKPHDDRPLHHLGGSGHRPPLSRSRCHFRRCAGADRTGDRVAAHRQTGSGSLDRVVIRRVVVRRGPRRAVLRNGQSRQRGTWCRASLRRARRPPMAYRPGRAPPLGVSPADASGTGSPRACGWCCGDCSRTLLSWGRTARPRG